MILREYKVLFVGFERFGPYSFNVAEQLVDALDNQTLQVANNIKLSLRGASLPIDFSTFRSKLVTLIESIQADIVFGLGMDFKDFPYLSCELQAGVMPCYGAHFQDAHGQVGPTAPLDNDTHNINVPRQGIFDSALSRTEGIESSHDAGQHMCETVLRDLIRLSRGGYDFLPGFLHLPHTPELIPESAGFAQHHHSLSFHRQQATVQNFTQNIAELLFAS